MLDCYIFKKIDDLHQGVLIIPSNHQVLCWGGHAGYLLIYTVGKLLAFNLSVSARFPGDTLEPVLIAGAFLGGAVGNLGIHLGVRKGGG